MSYTTNDYYLNGRMADVSAVGEVSMSYIPETGNVIAIRTVTSGVITTADDIVTFTFVDAAGTVTSIGTITVALATSNAEGDVDSMVLPALGFNVKAGGYIKASSNGASNTGATLYIMYTIRR